MLLLADLFICLTSFHDIPLTSLKKPGDDSIAALTEQLAKFGQQKVCVVCVCRQGNDSQLAVQALTQKLVETGVKDTQVKDIRRGLYGWQRHVDKDFPLY